MTDQAHQTGGLVPSYNMAMETPATFINQFQVLVAAPNVRIAFAEGFTGQPPSWRSSVVMTVEDARTLAMTILGNLPPQGQGVLGGLAALGAFAQANKLGGSGGDS